MQSLKNVFDAMAEWVAAILSFWPVYVGVAVLSVVYSAGWHSGIATCAA